MQLFERPPHHTPDQCITDKTNDGPKEYLLVVHIIWLSRAEDADERTCGFLVVSCNTARWYTNGREGVGCFPIGKVKAQKKPADVIGGPPTMTVATASALPGHPVGHQLSLTE
jgi:hypothetical protein